MSRMSDGGTSQFYHPVPQPYFPPQISDDVLKVGAQVDTDLCKFFSLNLADKIPYLFELDQREPLTKTVETLCSHWCFDTPDNFALKFSDKSKRYVTEENRTEITNGTVLLLSISPSRLCSFLVDRLAQQRDHFQQIKQQAPVVSSTFEDTLQSLCESSDDRTFVLEFVGQNGLPLLAGIIESCSFQLSQLRPQPPAPPPQQPPPPPLAFLLLSYWQAVEISATSWDVVPEASIGQMANYVLGRSKSEHPKALAVALTILEAVVSSSSNGHFVERDVPLEGLIRHLENSDAGVQQQTLALMNALFSQMNNETKKQETAVLLNSKPVRSAIVKNVLRDRSVGVELTHQLYVFQRLTLNALDNRAMTKPSNEKVNEFVKLALSVTGGYDGTNSPSPSGSSALSPSSIRRNNAGVADGNCYKRLGFLNLTNPVDDFDLAPPGLLALDCLHYLAKRHPERFAKIIIENSCRTDGRDYPFVQTSLQIISLLLAMLNIGEAPQDEGGFYYEVLFTHECAFEELAAHLLVVFSRTWKETCALYPDDLSTVLQVVDEQVRRSLSEKPRTFDQLDELMRKYSYREIARIRENERALKEKSEFESRPILELQEKLKPELLLLVRANRLNGMKEGQTFAKYSRGVKGTREKGKFWHWKLSLTEQCLMYEDCDEKVPPKTEDMKNKVLISDIERIVFGIDCPHVAREAKLKKVGTVMAFTIFVNSSGGSECGCFNFLAPCMPTYYLWIDGLSALLNQPMPSTQAAEDVNMLLNMEVKVRLLDLEDTVLPTEPPPIPSPPPNFNF